MDEDEACSSPVPLPIQVDGLDARWATEVLRTRVPGVTVTRLDVLSARAGSSSTFRLALDYASGSSADLPATLYLKGNFDLGADHGLLPDYEVEVGFYRRFSADFEPFVPHCWFAGIDRNSGQALVLLEDLTATGARFCTAPDPLSVDTVRGGLEFLARLHGRWWGGPLPRLRNARTDGTDDAASDVLFHPVHWARSLDSEAGALLPATFRDREFLAPRMARLFERNREIPLCLVHGDAHPDNWFVRADGTAGLFDWGPYAGTWAREVAYFLVGALAIEDRRRAERELVGHYLDALARSGGPKLELDDAWDAYRWNITNGVFWFLCPPQSQAQAVINANVERFVAAALDHDSIALLD